MTQTTIMVIDDSATIRRLVDSELSRAGYHVVTAANAEDGVQRAADVQPALIILDHQLPGTTGFQVCEQLLANPDLSRIPVVISSTLRKKAYAEYTDLANVVDMLPKPYTGELLNTTVANALDTGAMIVASQAAGTAVPEVIQEFDDARLAGQFGEFSLREILDFLNNGAKQGVLETEGEFGRVWFYLKDRRIQAVTATGVEPSIIAQQLPDSLEDLAPVLKFTVGGRTCSEMDGLVELLDRKVLDPRLLRKLLRHQAAILTRACFTQKLTTFRFQTDAPLPPMFQKLNLDISLLALLVDGAVLHCTSEELPPDSDDEVFVRCEFHGQNLDRAGLSATHMKVLGLLTQPASADAVAEKLGCSRDEARRVLYGFVLADLVAVRRQVKSHVVVAIERDTMGTQQIRHVLTQPDSGFTGRVVRDGLALQLLLKRCRPDIIVVAIDDDACRSLADELDSKFRDKLENAKWVGIGDASNQITESRAYDAIVTRPYNAESLKADLEAAMKSETKQLCEPVA